jgi:FkbM family methyltransferase
MKAVIKNTLDSLGYEIKRKNIRDMFAIRHKFDETLLHLREIGFYPDLVIDVGAADGTPPLQKHFPDSYFFWIEPLQEFEPALKKLQLHLNGEYLIAGVGKEEGSFDFNVHDDLHGSTMFNETEGTHADGKKRQVPVLTLNKLNKIYNWQQFERVLLKADVQGFELEVLKGADDIFPNVEVMILEVALFKFLRNAPDFHEVVDYMKNIGYVVFDIIGGINRPLDFSLGQVDLVFVKEDGIFRQSHGWAK